MKKYKYRIARILLLLICLNLIITQCIQRAKNTKLTETELFLAMPGNFIWRFR